MSNDKWIETHVSGMLQRSPAKLPHKDEPIILHSDRDPKSLLDREKNAKLEWDNVVSGKITEINRVWKLPHFYTQKTERDQKIARANKYLSYMLKKLQILVKTGELRKAWIYGDILLRRSSSYLAMNYIKADKGWFWKFSEDKNKEYMKRHLDINRKKLTSLKVIRSYIKKPNGKMRPIGAPVQGDKAALTGISEILKLIIEPTIGNYQHGFMTGRSIQQALIKLVEKLKKGEMVYQFDLSSFFNKVNVNLICGRVNSLANGLGRWILGITKNTYPRLKVYHPESEITQIKTNKGILWRKGGFTQGSPLSPLLCNIAMEFANFKAIPGLIQFADDGLITSPSKYEIRNPFDNPKARLAGIHLAMEKNHGWSMRFKFLGIYFDLWNRTMIGPDGTELRYNESSYYELLLFIKRYGNYTEAKFQREVIEGSKWYWKVSNESLCAKWNKIYPSLGKKVETYTKEGVKVDIYGRGITPEWYQVITTTWGRFWYKPLMESTKGSRYLLDYYDSLKKYRLTNVTERDYDQLSSTEWWQAKAIGNKVWVQYPDEWHTKNAENDAINLGKRLLEKAKAKA